MRLSIDQIKSYVWLSTPFLFFFAGVPFACWMGAHSVSQLQLIHPPSWHFELQYGISRRADLEGLKDAIVVLSKDPFTVDKRLSPLPESLPRLQLSMVVKNKGHSFCRINGILYKEGQKGPDFEILKIEDDGVLITRYGKEIWISFQEQKNT